MNTLHTIGAIITLQALDTQVINELMEELNTVDPLMHEYLSVGLKTTILLVYLYLTIIKRKNKEG